MGNSQSKLAFKQGIFRLSEPTIIYPNDPYWTCFWELPESAEDVFSLFSAADVRRTRDCLENLKTLLQVVSNRLIYLRNHPSFPDPELAPEHHALNCVRVLTRILPFVYEVEELEEWETRIFWEKLKKKTREAELRTEVLFDRSTEDAGPDNRSRDEDFYEAKPLGEELIDTLIDLLFFIGFTIPRVPNARSKVSYTIWQSGVGCNSSVGSNRDLESNRTEIMRLLLTLASKSMYMPSNLLPVKGVKAITYLVSCQDKLTVLSVLCSLLNTAMKYNPMPWKLPYDYVVWKDPKQTYISYCLQLLLVFLLYPIPEDGRGVPPKNYYRHYFGRLHRSQDFEFIVNGMTTILNQPMQASSLLPGNQKSGKWVPEMIMLFWEALQCNRSFRSFIIESNHAYDFVILCIYYATQHRADPSKQGVAKMCIYVLQTISVEPGFGMGLNRAFETQDALPSSIRLSDFRGTYGDFLVRSIASLMATNRGKIDALYPVLIAILNNIGPYLESISSVTSQKINQLFITMSSPRFLLANETNQTLLHSLLEFINSILEHQFSKSPQLVYAILRSKSHYEALRKFTLNAGMEELERQSRRRKEASVNTEEINSPTISHVGDEHAPGSSRRHLSHVPEDGTFAIGDDDSEEEEETPNVSSQRSRSPETSRPPSVASTTENVPLQLRGMSEKARGKLPAGQMTFSRHSSSTSLASYSMTPISNPNGFIPTATWIESWVTELPLHTILTIIAAVLPDGSGSDLPNPSEPGAQPMLSELPFYSEEPSIRAAIADRSSPKVHLFEWTPLSLGWYESLLWGFIFTSEMFIGSAAGSTPGAIGVWNGTAIKLFRVQETAIQGPSLMAPKGAVDAVGKNLVQRIGNLNFRGRSSASSEGQSETGTPGTPH